MQPLPQKPEQITPNASSSAEQTQSREGTRKRRRRNNRQQGVRLPGSIPGLLVSHPDANQSRLSITAYSALGIQTLESCDLKELKELAGKHSVLWINVDGLADVVLVQDIGELFGINRLALEDVLNAQQRPKFETHDAYEFVVIRKVIFDPSGLQNESVALFFGRGWLVTFHESLSDYLAPVRERLGKSRGRLRKSGSDYLAYCILDCVIDHYFPALNFANNLVAALDEEIFTGAGENFPNDVRGLRSDLVSFLRLATPVRDVLNKMLMDPGGRISPSTIPYLKDCLDHILQVIDQIGALRHATSDLMNHYHLAMTHRMNETMKVLTMIATIFIPLTFITSIYGMNFDTSVSALAMPELRWRFGYPAVLLFMLALGLGMLFYFRRKGWLTSTRPRRRRGAP